MNPEVLKWDRRLSILKHIIGILVVILIALSTSLLVYIALRTNRNTNQLINCTTPGHSCYEQGRSATTGAVGTISKVTVAAVYCSGKLGPSATIAQLNICVTAQIK